MGYEILPNYGLVFALPPIICMQLKSNTGGYAKTVFLDSRKA
jgi:hypothetical protein